jgi:hypothetical protein
MATSHSARLRNVCESLNFNELRSEQQDGGWKIYAIREIDEVGYVWMDRARRVIAMSPDCWRILSQDSSQRWALLQTFREGASGIRELPFHEEPYLSLALEDARTRGTDVVQVQDRINQLEMNLHRLAQESESLRDPRVSPQSKQVFALRFVQAQEEHEKLTTELARLGSFLRLVGDSVNAMVTGS